MVLCSAMLFFAMETTAQAQSALTRHTRKAVTSGQAKFFHRLPGTQTLRIDIVLALRDEAGLEKFLQEVYDPASPYFRHFLTVPEFTARFGPSQEDYETVVGYAQSHGLKVVGGSRDAMDVQLEGSVTSIESAFNVSMGVYQHPTEDRQFYAPDREPSVYLPFPVWHISGLDNYSIPHPASLHKRPAGTPIATTGSGPGYSFLGSDMRAAYYGTGSLTGAGQSVGLLEYAGTDLADVNTYYGNIGQTNTVPITLLSTDGTSTSCVAPGCDDTEQTLDITQALGMAPGLSSLVVYIGSSDTAIISTMTTHNPLPTSIGCSWGWTPVDPSTLDPYFQKMAAQGQTFFAASGDNGNWATAKYVWPADDAYVVSVGGTQLFTTGAGGGWSSETAWADSGGGITRNGIPIPSWQQLSGVINSSNQGSKTLRNGPDVSANAYWSFYVCSNQTTCTSNNWGGTSFAAPMWAGYLALANQQAVAGGSSTLGSINSIIYPLGLGSGYSADFHDITSGSNGLPAVAGYDLVTGWGSPNAGLISALVTAGTAPTFSLSASPTSVSVAQGNAGNSTITSTVVNGFNSAVALSASGQPGTVTVGFNPTSITGTGTSIMTMTVGSTTAVGTYTITVSGTGNGITQTTTVKLTVTGLPPDFTIGASPSSVSVMQGKSGPSTITTAALNGFSSSIALSASGLPKGVTAGFSPTSIPAPGSGTSTLTLTVSATAATGTHTITITGKGGGITHTTTVSLTVTAAPVADFTISANPTLVSVARGSSGTSTISTGVINGFSSSISLSASGLPKGVSASFTPSSVAAGASSTLKLTVTSRASAGTKTITITGSGGGKTHTTTISLTVT